MGVVLSLVLVACVGQAEGQSLDAGSALRFDGAVETARVASSPALNSYPLTVTAWLRTTDTVYTARGVVSKYADASFNGWSILLSEGVVHAWYCRDGFNCVFAAPLGLDSGFVADGQWHHIALVVDATGGKLYVDGVLPGPRSTLAWPLFSIPGPVTSTAPLQIGYYHNYPNSIDGEIDEVSVWSVAKSASEVRELRRTPPVGNEAGLQAYWKFDNGAGTVVTDSSVNARHLSFLNSPEWVESTVLFGSRLSIGIPGIGDLQPDNIIASDALNPDPHYTREGVQASSTLSIYRPAGGPAETIDLAVAFRLIDPGGQPVPLATGGDEVVVPVPVTFPGSATPTPSQFLQSLATLIPAAPLDNRTLYRVEAVVRRADPGSPGSYVEVGRRNNDGFQYWHFTSTESGDASDNLLGRLDSLAIPRRVVIGSQLLTELNLSLRRYDEFEAAAPTEKEFEFVVTSTLIDVTDGVEIPLALPPAPFVASLESFRGDAPRVPSDADLSTEIYLRPAVALPPGHDFRVDVEVSWTDGDGSPRSLTGSTDVGPLVALSGRLFFGPLATTFTALNALPSGDGFGNTILDLAAAHITGFPNHTFSGPVTVTIDPITLDATVVEAFVNVTGPVPDIGHAAGVRIERGPITLDHGGAYAAVTVWFPAGFGAATPTNFQPDPAAALWPKALAGTRRFDAALRPLGGGTTLSAASIRLANAPLAGGEILTGQLFCCHEKLACWLPASSITWDPAAGTFTLPAGPAQWVRSDEMAALPGDVTHPSNDQFLAGATNTSGQPVVISTSPSGVALLNATVTLAAASVRPHFPSGAAYSYTSGQMVFFESALDPAQSSLDGVASLTQEYSRNCADAPKCAATTAAPAILTHTPDSASLRFTPDLGLVANGFVSPATIVFGTVDQGGPGGTHRFAHTASGFSAAVYHQAGMALPASATSPRNEDRPGVLLLSGHQSFADPGLVERPGGPGYSDGLESDGQANYPGLNYRVREEPGGATGRALVSAQTIGPFPLTARSKYYVRGSGVSGIHERVSTGTPLNLQLYGFQTRLDYFKLSYLSNENKDSVCDGGLTVPWPAGFQQEFLDLRFTCRGQPSAARLPADGNHHDLEYWGHADFDTLSLAFNSPKPVFGCTDLPRQDEGYLLLGVSMVDLPLIATPQKPLNGSLGFKNNGRLITKADQAAPNGVARGTGTDSRLDLPASLHVIPPLNGQLIASGGFPFIPTTKGYFNDPPAGQTGGTDGFVSFAGKLALPFFEEAKIHLHAIPEEGNNGVRFMGGWPASDQGGAGEGWADAQGRTFFTHPADFDPAHVGHPGNLAAYRDPGGSSQYRPRARKRWLDLINFDYPLVWEKERQRFKSLETPKTKLLVLEIENRLRFLNSEGGEIVMGATGGLPELNAQQLILGAADLAAGGFFSDLDRAIDEAIAGGLTSAADAVKLTDAAKALDELLGDKLSTIAADPFDTLLNQIIDPVVDSFYPAGQATTATLADLRAALCGNPANLNDKGIVGTTKWVDRMVKESGEQNLRFKVRAALVKAQDGASSVRDIVKKYPGPTAESEPRRRIVTRLLEVIAKGVIGVSEVPGVVKEKAQEYIDDQAFAQEIENYPAWDEIEKLSSRLAIDLQGAITALQDGGTFDIDMDKIADSLEAAQLTLEIRTAVCQALDLQASLGASLAEHPPAALKERIKNEVRDRFYASFVPEDLQFVFRARLGTQRGLFRQLLDDVIAEMTSAAREAIRRGAVELAADVPFLSDASGFLGFPGDSAQGVAMKGYGRIIGNSMAETRIDGQIRLGLADNSGFTFDGFVLIRDLQVTGPSPNCGAPGAAPGAKSEVTVGAKVGAKSQGGGFGSGMQFGIQAQFAFDGAGDVLGFLGKVELKPGPAGKIGKTSLNEVTLELAWIPGGEGVAANRYIKAILDGVVDGIGAKVRLFAGETCDILALGVFDKYIQGAMKGLAELDYPGDIKRVAGVYVSTDGQFPIEKLIGLPADNPLISAIAKGGWSWMLLVPGGNVGSPTLCLGYRESLGLDVKALVILEASLEIGIAGIACVSADFFGVPPDLSAVRAACYGRGEVCVGIDLLIKKFKICAGLEVTGTLHGTDVEITGASF